MTDDSMWIENLVAPLIGETTWAPKLGSEKRLILDFGQPRPPNILKNVFGEWRLLVYSANWAIFHHGDILTYLDDEIDKQVEVLGQLEGLAIIGFRMNWNRFGAYFAFENLMVLTLFPINSQNVYHWLLYMPDRYILTVGPNKEWSHTYEPLV